MFTGPVSLMARMRHRVAALVLGGAGFVFSGCDNSQSPRPPQGTPLPATGDVWLRDVTQEQGLSFRHQPGRFEAFEMPSIMGSGAALTDLDLDGQLELYLVQGQRSPARDGFYRRLANGKFEDNFERTGINSSRFGMGAWFGDYDQDGFPDLLLTSVGGNQLFQNQGDGTFVERKLVETDPGAWSTAASWADFNQDGLLDIVIANYVDYVPGQHCEGPDGKPDFCGPDAYPGSGSVLYMNNGAADEGSVFDDVTLAKGLANERTKGLGLLTRDFDGDGRIDILIANDLQPNDLWIQQSDGTFQERGELLGLARNFLGQSEANMGVVSGDWNGDNQPDVFITHLAGETNTLYLSGTGYWRDATPDSALGPPSLPHTGFGVAAVDLDQDGDTDFLIANGAVKRPSSSRSGQATWGDYSQPNQLYRRDSGKATWSECSAQAGSWSQTKEISRAICVTDFDGDGDRDFLLTNCAGPARLYENVAPRAGHWLSLRLIDTRGNREAIGAAIRVIVDRDTAVLRDVNPYQGYLSQNDLRGHFGLGSSTRFDAIEVLWADGQREAFPGGAADVERTLIRGTGRALQESPSAASGASEGP